MCEQTCYLLLVSVGFCVSMITGLVYIKELHFCHLVELLVELLMIYELIMSC